MSGGALTLGLTNLPAPNLIRPIIDKEKDSTIKVRCRHIVQQSRDRRPQHTPRRLMVVNAPRLQHIPVFGSPLEQSSSQYPIARSQDVVTDDVVGFFEYTDDAGAGEGAHHVEEYVGVCTGSAPDDVVAPERQWGRGQSGRGVAALEESERG